MRHIQDILVLLGCLAVLHASDDGEEAREFHGGVGCPCIEVDHAALSAQFPESNIEVDDAAGCLRAPRSAEGVGATRTSCFPITYGSTSCRAWDAELPPFCADKDGEALSTADPSCAYAWCFINATQCRRSSTVYTHSRLYPQADLFYSYDTCIAHDDTTQQDWPFRRYESWRQLGGRRLRIGVPYMAEPFYFKQVGEERVEWQDEGAQAVYMNDTLGAWTGIAPHFMQSVLQQTTLIPGAAPASAVFTWTSVGTRSVHNSMFTACVHDVHSGLLDLCIGDFWLTPERLELTPFTTPVTLEHLHLFAPSKNRRAERTMQKATKVYEVFSESLWLTIVVGAVSAGLLDVWLNNAWKPTKLIWERKTKSEKALYFMEAWSFGIFRFFFDFVAGGPDPQEAFLMPWPSRLLKFGWGFFVLVALTSYTANLAAFLTRTASSTTTNVASMDQVVEQGQLICAHSAIQELLTAQYEDATNANLFRWYANTDAVLQGFANRECEVVTASVDAITLSPARTSFCCQNNLVSIGLLVSIPVAFPASPEVVNALSYWITQTQQPGTRRDRQNSASWARSTSEFKPATAECDVLAVQNELADVDELLQLTWQHLLGPVLALIFFAAISIAMKIVLKWRHISRRMERVRYSLETGGWRQSSHDAVSKVLEADGSLLVERSDGSVVVIPSPGHFSVADGLRLSQLANTAVAARMSIDEERDAMPPPRWSNAMRSETFQDNMLNSMYGGPMRSFSGGSHTSFEREVRSGLASNMKFKAPPLSRAQAPSSGVHWEDAAPRDHARQHSDVHQFQGNAEFDQMAEPSVLPEDVQMSFDNLRQLLDTPSKLGVQRELMRQMENNYGPVARLATETWTEPLSSMEKDLDLLDQPRPS